MPTTRSTTATAAAPGSLVLHAAARHYDLLAWVLTLGRERALRERLAEIARLAPGEAVLDVGCGTGSLALAAKRRVGPAGRVHGVDASPEMIAQARARAASERLDVTFAEGRAEVLPLADASVDVVLGTLMLHHLPSAVRDQFAGEVRRVLKPGGRVLAADFEPPARGRGGPVSRLHRHGHVPLREIVALLDRAGLRVEETGAVGAADLRYALARVPAPGDAGAAPEPSHRDLPALPVPRWLPALAIGTLVAAHLLALRAATRGLVIGALATVAVVALLLAFAVVHLGSVAGRHGIRRQHRHRS